METTPQKETEMDTTTESEFAEALAESVQSFADDGFDYTAGGALVERVASFEEAGLLSMNQGLVVTLSDGSEFQVTVVRSR